MSFADRARSGMRGPGARDQLLEKRLVTFGDDAKVELYAGDVRAALEAARVMCRDPGSHVKSCRELQRADADAVRPEQINPGLEICASFVLERAGLVSSQEASNMRIDAVVRTSVLKHG